MLKAMSNDPRIRSRLNVIFADMNAERARKNQPRLTVRELAKVANLPPSVVSRLLSNKAVRIDYGTLERLCDALHCTPGDLFEYTPRQHQN